MNKKKPKAKPPIKKKAKTSPASKIIKKAKSKKPKVSEEELLQVLDKITKKLIHKFRFGYHSAEDMKQQASIFALEALDRYDGKRPLENFLWTHVRNRLFNFKRNNYQRPDSPCITCPLYDKHMKNSSNGCLKYEQKLDCSLYNNWFTRNENKKNIMQPSYIDNDQEYFCNKFGEDLVSNKEIIEFLDSNIHQEYRESYLKLKHGSKITKDKLDKLKKHILSLLSSKNMGKDLL